MDAIRQVMQHFEIYDLSEFLIDGSKPIKFWDELNLEISAVLSRIIAPIILPIAGIEVTKLQSTSAY